MGVKKTCVPPEPGGAAWDGKGGSWNKNIGTGATVLGVQGPEERGDKKRKRKVR